MSKNCFGKEPGCTFVKAPSNNTEYLESKKLDSTISGKQKETISAVLKELEFSLGLK